MTGPGAFPMPFNGVRIIPKFLNHTDLPSLANPNHLRRLVRSRKSDLARQKGTKRRSSRITSEVDFEENQRGRDRANASRTATHQRV